jgi:hypothetical protein
LGQIGSVGVVETKPSQKRVDAFVKQVDQVDCRDLFASAYSLYQVVGFGLHLVLPV